MLLNPIGMKSISFIIILSVLIEITGQAQLLSRPDLSSEDFEIALTNPGHLRKILEKHNFKSVNSGPENFTSLGKITNPYFPEVRAFKSERWELSDKENNIVLRITLNEWEADHRPYPGVIKTISLVVRKNSAYSDNLEKFLEQVKSRFPVKKVRVHPENERYRQFTEPLYILSNDSGIEVRAGTSEITYGVFHSISFDLIEGKNNPATTRFSSTSVK